MYFELDAFIDETIMYGTVDIFLNEHMYFADNFNT